MTGGEQPITITPNLKSNVETALLAKARQRGKSPATVVEPAPTEEEIDENRAKMLGRFPSRHR